MRLVGPILLLALVVATSRVAVAADFFNQTVSVALLADGGPSTSTVSSALVGGVQYALQCTDETRYRVCERHVPEDDGGLLLADGGQRPNVCVATATDMLLEAKKILDVPMPREHTRVALLASDGGVRTCNLFRVLPRTHPE